MIDRIVSILCIAAFAALALSQCTEAKADPALIETRYLDPNKGEKVARLADGSIRRRADVIAAFRKIHPCPSTGLTTGACAGWAVDHVLPLYNNGADVVSNLQWLPNILKSGSGKYPKDRWERVINSPSFAPILMPTNGVLIVK